MNILHSRSELIGNGRKEKASEERLMGKEAYPRSRGSTLGLQLGGRIHVWITLKIHIFASCTEDEKDESDEE